jgi:hypothetical protein
VVGVFSWPAAEKTFWVAKMLWHWSFASSVFSLISSAQLRLLDRIPSDLGSGNGQRFLGLFLTLGTTHRASWKMTWVWQCPTMLMSYSWMLFLVGYAIHVLDPVTGGNREDMDKTVRVLSKFGLTLVGIC